MAESVVPHAHGRRGLAAADARHADHANVGTQRVRQLVEERLRSRQMARQRLADPHGDGRRRGFVGVDDVEVVIERGHFVHLGHRELHFLRQRDDVRRRNAAAGILDPVQVLDQERPLAGRVAEQHPDVGERVRIDGAALRPSLDAAFAA